MNAIPLEPDDIAHPGAITHRELNHRLLIHEQVFQDAHTHPNIRQRLSMALQHLAARGRTTIVKSCSGDNRHWRRSPIGGNGGMQFYLWWTTHPDPQSQPAICIRAARHHDDHTPLPIGDLDRNYLPLSQPDFDGTDESIAPAPWTPTQQEFIRSAEPVRIIHGHPGSGKTTALWRAIETRINQSVLYISWSRALVAQAAERFSTFAPSDTTVECTDFISLLNQLSNTDVPRQTIDLKHAIFQRALNQARIPRSTMAPWHHYPQSLFAEIRSTIVGMANPSNPEHLSHRHSQSGVTLRHLSAAQYLAQRPQLPPTAANAVHNVFRLLISRQNPEILDCLPEFIAAIQAIERLQNGVLPTALTKYDRIVVDEAQDLTSLEFQVIVELLAAIARRRDYSPHLLISGDEGQTVLPTAFKWANVSNAVSAQGLRPTTFHLDSILRSPRRIADTIDNSSMLYQDLKRIHRPGQQRNTVPSDHSESQTIICIVPNVNEMVRLIERIATIPNTVVITPDLAPPDYLPADAVANLLTSSTAKGLEYQHVCLLTPHQAITDIANDSLAQTHQIQELETRNSIDRLRVTISRATETLVALELADNPRAIALSEAILSEYAYYEPDQLVQYLTNSDQSPEDTIIDLMDRAEAILDTAPPNARTLIAQSIALLGIPGSPTAVNQPDLTARVHQANFLCAVRIITETDYQDHQIAQLLDSARQSLVVLDQSKAIPAFDQAIEWLLNPTQPPFPMLRALGNHQISLLPIIDALTDRNQRILQSIHHCVQSTADLHLLTEDVAGWLTIIGYPDDPVEYTEAIRLQAIRHFLLEREETPGEVLLNTIQELVNLADATDPVLLGTLRHLQNRLEEAAQYYRQAGMTDQADQVDRQRAQPLVEQAGFAAERENYTQAEQLAKDALAIYHKSPQAHLTMALIRKINEQYDDARQHARSAMRYAETDEEQCMAHSTIGHINLETGEFEQATQDFTAAIALMSKPSVAIHLARGYAYESNSQVQAAARDYRTAVQLDPNSAPAHHRLATADYAQAREHSDQGNNIGAQVSRESARYHARRACELEPESQLYRDTQHALEEVYESKTADLETLSQDIHLQPLFERVRAARSSLSPHQPLPQSPSLMQNPGTTPGCSDAVQPHGKIAPKSPPDTP